MSTSRKKKATGKTASKKAQTKKKRTKTTKAAKETTPEPVLADPQSPEPEVQLPSDEQILTETVQAESSPTTTTDAFNELASQDEAPAPEPELAPNHRKLIEDSAIDPEVARERGYRTVTVRAELRRLGFGDGQLSVPTLLLPVHDEAGQVSSYQSRPDNPRIKDGKPLKYETPRGTRMVLDIPRRARAWIGDPTRPLFITEGIRKADSAVCLGLCCLALLGIWNWRGTNAHGGKTALAVWESIALKGRVVYLVFDSDVMTKHGVHASLSRLKAFFESRGAKVFVIYLPAAEGGAKIGLDDYLAVGHTVDDLLLLATSELRKLEDDGAESEERYAKRDGNTVYLKRSAEGGVAEEVLAEFTAEVVGDITEDDGAEPRRVFDMEATVRQQVIRFMLPVERFAALTWVTEHLGVKAILRAGFGTKDRMREAILKLSRDDIPQRRVFLHTGWRQRAGKWIYLHAGGAIGEEGVVDNLEVRLSAPLDRYVLPVPPHGETLRESVRESLALLDGLAPPEVIMPQAALPFMAVVRSAGQSCHSNGTTGSGKTEIASLFQSFFGEGMDAQNLPASWSSTGNALEGLAFLTMDALLTIDDFNPTGSTTDVQRYHKDADRVFRGQANNRGRSRMRPDGTLRPEKHPRGVILSTGEDVPAGHSLRARMLVINVPSNCVNFSKLTARQKARPHYSRMMAGFIKWAAGRLSALRAECAEEVLLVRELLATKVSHRRTATLGAEFLVGFGLFVRFAHEVGVLTASEARTLKQWAVNAMEKVLAAQAAHQAAADPAHLYLQLVGAALQAGAAHLADRSKGERPRPDDLARAVGWRNPDNSGWRASEPLIGWIHPEEGEVFLLEGPAYKVAQQQGSASPIRIGIGERALCTALKEKGLLLSHNKDRLTAKIRADGRNRNCLHIALDDLIGPASEDDHDEQAGGDGPLPVDGPNAPGGTTDREHETASKSASATPPGPPSPDAPDAPAVGDKRAKGERGVRMHFVADVGLIDDNADVASAPRPYEPSISVEAGGPGAPRDPLTDDPAEGDSGTENVPGGGFGPGAIRERTGSTQPEVAAVAASDASDWEKL